MDTHFLNRFFCIFNEDNFFYLWEVLFITSSFSFLKNGMGNRLCGEVGMRCVANCARITVNSDYHDFDCDDTFSSTCDPAGTIFNDTLEGLPYIDRQLLLFCSGRNVELVRWLFLLGAKQSAADLNQTTPLHAACRSGTIVIVKELVSRGMALDVVDCSGWTPLHIATFMGRKYVVSYLLMAGAPLWKLNNKNQSPSDLCNDSFTREVIESFASTKHDTHSLQSSTSGSTGWPPEDIASREKLPGLRYEPFFVPRQPIIQAARSKKEMMAIGLDLFNRKPGQGLAFLVTTGCVRDYPVDMSAFLSGNKVDLEQVGKFLGESYSLSQILRLEFINSVTLVGHGVVSSVARTCKSVILPADLQKIDRLLHSAARIWWRQHEQDCKWETELLNTKQAADGNEEFAEPEIRGLELKQYFSSPDSLYQLMYGVVLLHWSLHDSDMHVTIDQWLELNKGLEGDERNIPKKLLESVYETVKRKRLPQLTIHDPRKMGPEFNKPSKKSFVAKTAIQEACMREEPLTLLLNAKHSPLNNSSSLHHLTSVMTEVADAFDHHSKQNIKRSSSRSDAMGRTAHGKIHAQLTSELLFFCSKPNEDPFAFMPLANFAVNRISPIQCSASPVASTTEEDSSESDAEKFRETSLHLVFLLPDGRWQTYELNGFDFQTESKESMDGWMRDLSACRPECY